MRSVRLNANACARIMASLFLACAVPVTAGAQDMSAFRTGPVFTDFGAHAPVYGQERLPADSEFRIAFDVSQPAEDGQRNRGIESAARFINMHAAAGVDPANIHVVVVIHGQATRDVLTSDAWTQLDLGTSNPSAAMVRSMLNHGVRFIVCGQSMAAMKRERDELIPGVQSALSAMTVHALLQQRGYTINPF